MTFFRSASTALAIMLGVVVFSANQSSAAFVVDPNVGGTFGFDWTGGLGPINGIDFGSETEWSMTVATDSVLSLVAADDLFAPGDEFELVFDGAVIPWTQAFIFGSGFFRGELTGLVLLAGLHTFSLNLTALALDGSGDPFLEGGAEMTFGIATASAVPLPAAWPLFATGTGLLGFMTVRRKRRKVSSEATA